MLDIGELTLGPRMMRLAIFESDRSWAVGGHHRIDLYFDNTGGAISDVVRCVGIEPAGHDATRRDRIDAHTRSGPFARRCGTIEKCGNIHRFGYPSRPAVDAGEYATIRTSISIYKSRNSSFVSAFDSTIFPPFATNVTCVYRNLSSGVVVVKPAKDGV